MIIFHGNNQVASREAYLAARESVRKKGFDIQELQGESITQEELEQINGIISLFNNQPVIAIEGFFSRRPSNEKKKIQEYLETNSKSEILIWEGKDVSTQLKAIPVTNVKKFDLPKTIWKFLDTFALSELNATLNNTAPEMIFSLLAGQVRKLIMVNDDVVTLPAWQAGKLKAQAKKYGVEKLLNMHQSLLEMDYRQKTSGSAMDMAAQLQVWVLKYS